MPLRVLIVDLSHNVSKQLAFQYRERNYDVWGTYGNDLTTEKKHEFLTKGIALLPLFDPTYEAEVQNAARCFGGYRTLNIFILPPCICKLDDDPRDVQDNYHLCVTGTGSIIEAFLPSIKQAANARIIQISSVESFKHNISGKSADIFANDLHLKLMAYNISLITLQTRAQDLEGSYLSASVEKMINVTEGLGFGDNGTVWHIDGYQMASGEQADDSNKEKAAPIKDKATINEEKAALNKTLQSDKRKIESICRISGVVGAFITVIDGGAVVFKEGIGYRDYDTKEPVTAETIFPIAGLTESMTGFCLDQLRGRGKLSYADAIFRHLPQGEDSDPGRANVVTIADLVAHRTGVQEGSRIWEGAGGQVILNSEQISTVFREFIPRGSLRAVFNRCSLGYAILGNVIAKVSGQPYHDYLGQNVLGPLSMTRTVVINNNVSADEESDNSDEVDWGIPIDENHTQAYNVWGETNNPHPVPLPGLDASGPLGAAEGLLSTANDLATFYKLLMRHWFIQNKLEDGPQREAESILLTGGDIRWLFTPLQVMETPTFREKSYATGWARSQLPGTVSNFTVNAELVEKMPILGAGILPPTETRLALWNQGSCVGASHFVMLLPETESAVIVLTNTTTRNDAAHWIGQLLVETLLAKESDSQPRTNDYVRLAIESVSKARKKYDELTQDMQIGAVSGGPKRKLKEYVGLYVGIAGSFALEIVLDDGKLEMRMQGRKTQGYTLSHHHDDTFTWFMSYDEQVERGRRVHYHPTPFFIEFRGKPINCIRWIQDPVGRPDGELLAKKTGK